MCKEVSLEMGDGRVGQCRKACELQMPPQPVGTDAPPGAIFLKALHVRGSWHVATYPSAQVCGVELVGSECAAQPPARAFELISTECHVLGGIRPAVQMNWWPPLPCEGRKVS